MEERFAEHIGVSVTSPPPPHVWANTDQMDKTSYTVLLQKPFAQPSYSSHSKEAPENLLNENIHGPPQNLWKESWRKSNDSTSLPSAHVPAFHYD